MIDPTQLEWLHTIDCLFLSLSIPRLNTSVMIKLIFDSEFVWIEAAL